MKQLLTTLLLITTILCCRAQEQVCLSDFDYIIRRIKKDYPGYHDKVNEQNISDLVQLENDLREKIALHPDSCFRCLNRYTSWFKDHHLRVTYNYNHYSDSKKKHMRRNMQNLIWIRCKTIQNPSKGFGWGLQEVLLLKKSMRSILAFQ